MRWILLDVAIVGFSLVVLGLSLLGLWRKVKGLGRAIAHAGEVAERAADGLAVTRPPGPAPGSLPPRQIGGRAPRGRR